MIWYDDEGEQRIRCRIWQLARVNGEWSTSSQLHTSPLFCFDSSSAHLIATRGRCLVFNIFIIISAFFVKWNLIYCFLAGLQFVHQFPVGKEGHLPSWEEERGMFFSVLSLSLSDQTDRHAHNTYRCSRETLTLSLSLELLLLTHSEYRWIFDYSGFSSWNLHLHHVCFYC